MEKGQLVSLKIQVLTGHLPIGFVEIKPFVPSIGTVCTVKAYQENNLKYQDPILWLEEITAYVDGVPTPFVPEFWDLLMEDEHYFVQIIQQMINQPFKNLGSQGP